MQTQVERFFLHCFAIFVIWNRLIFSIGSLNALESPPRIVELTEWKVPFDLIDNNSSFTQKPGGLYNFYT